MSHNIENPNAVQKGDMKQEELAQHGYKHDPYCDCGICQFCNGDEDKYGNPTDRSVTEINSIRQSMKMIAAVECSECDEAKTESIPLNGDLLSFRLDFSKTAWKYGWIVESDKMLCPNCRADEEEWRSI